MRFRVRVYCFARSRRNKSRAAAWLGLAMFACVFVGAAAASAQPREDWKTFFSATLSEGQDECDTNFGDGWTTAYASEANCAVQFPGNLTAQAACRKGEALSLGQTYCGSEFENWDPETQGYCDCDLCWSRSAFGSGFAYFEWDMASDWNSACAKPGGGSHSNDGGSHQYGVEIDVDPSLAGEMNKPDFWFVIDGITTTQQGNTWHPAGSGSSPQAKVFWDGDDDYGDGHVLFADNSCSENVCPGGGSGCPSGADCDSYDTEVSLTNQDDAYVRVVGGNVQMAIKLNKIGSPTNLFSRFWTTQNTSFSNISFPWHDRFCSTDLPSKRYDTCCGIGTCEWVGTGPPCETPIATLTQTQTVTNTVPTNTPTRTATNTVPTNTPTRTATNTVPTNTRTRTATNTVPTNTPTRTATNTVPTNTPTRTATNTVPANTPTRTATNTPTRTRTQTPVVTPTRTPSGVPTSTLIPTADVSGCLYGEVTGEIVPGGHVEIAGPAPASVTVLADGSSGCYAFNVEVVPGTYTITVVPPQGFRPSSGCMPGPQQFDPTGEPPPCGGPPNACKLGQDVVGGYLVDPRCSVNPFFVQFRLDGGDPIIVNNHFPLHQIGGTVPAPVLSSHGLLMVFLALLAFGCLALRWMTAAGGSD